MDTVFQAVLYKFVRVLPRAVSKATKTKVFVCLTPMIFIVLIKAKWGSMPL